MWKPKLNTTWVDFEIGPKCILKPGNQIGKNCGFREMGLRKLMRWSTGMMGWREGEALHRFFVPFVCNLSTQLFFALSAFVLSIFHATYGHNSFSSFPKLLLQFQCNLLGQWLPGLPWISHVFSILLHTVRLSYLQLGCAKGSNMEGEFLFYAFPIRAFGPGGCGRRPEGPNPPGTN